MTVKEHLKAAQEQAREQAARLTEMARALAAEANELATLPSGAINAGIAEHARHLANQALLHAAGIQKVLGSTR